MPIVKRVTKSKTETRHVLSPRQQLAKRTLSEEINLLGTTNKPPQRLQDYFIFLYGEKGVGKTSLLAQFPGALIEQFEPRRRNLEIRQVSIAPMTHAQYRKQSSTLHPFRIFQASIEECLQSSKEIFIVIDTIDRAYDACLDCVCWEAGLDYPADNDYGKTWRMVKDEFESTLNRILYEGMGLAAISHARRWAQDSETAGESFDMVMPTCSPACWKICKAMTDYNFYYGYEGTQRVLAVRGTDIIWASSAQDDHFLAPNGEPLFTIPMGTSPKQGLANLLAAYSNKPPQGYRTVATVVPTNPTFSGESGKVGPVIQRRK